MRTGSKPLRSKPGLKERKTKAVCGGTLPEPQRLGNWGRSNANLRIA